MDQDGVILGLVEVQNGLQHIILDFDQAQGAVNRRGGLARDDGDRIADKTYAAVQDQAVIRRRLRIGLAGHGEPMLWHVLIGQDTGNARHLLGNVRVDLADERMGMRRAQDFHDQAVCRRDIVGINRLAGGQCMRVRLAHARSNIVVLHALSFSAKYFWMARSWLTYPVQRHRLPAR